MKHASRFLLAIFLMFAAGSLAACSEDDPVQDGIEGNGGGSGSGNGGESNGDEGGNDGNNEDESMNRNINSGRQRSGGGFRGNAAADA